MKLLYVIDSLAAGGAETSLAAVAPFLCDSGIELDVVHLEDRATLKETLEDAGANVVDLSGTGGRAARLQRLRRVLRARPPDLVHTTLFEADLLGRIAAVQRRIPIVSSLVNVGYGPEHFGDPQLSAVKLRAAQFADALTGRAVVRWHAITQHVADVMSRRLRIQSSIIDVVPRGRDPRALGERTPARRRAARSALGVEPAVPVILAAARQEWQKGLDILVEATPAILESIPDAHVLLAGRSGDQTSSLEDAVARLGVGHRVHFLGPRSDVPDLLCAADVFVMPSRWEGLGSILLEAMALRAPIVASDIPAVVETLGEPGRLALLVPSQDPRSLAAAVVAAVRDPQPAAARAHLAHQRFAARYTIEAVAAQTLQFYERALDTHRRSHASRSRRTLRPRSPVPTSPSATHSDPTSEP